MKLANQNVYYFLVIFLGVGFLAFLLFKPFLTAIMTAAILAGVFYGPYERILKLTKGRESLSSLLTSFLILIVVIVPIFFAAVLLGSEVNSFYKSFFNSSNNYEYYIEKGLNYAENNQYLRDYNIQEVVNTEQIAQSVQKTASGVIVVLEKVYKSITGFIIWVFVMFFTLYYLFIEGKRLAKKLIYISPLKDVYEKLLVKSFISMSKATLKGMIIIGIIQGVIGGVAFIIAGVPSPILWSVVMILLSMIPMVGAGLVWLPAGLIMLLLGNIWQGLLILVVGLGIISVIDNLLRPKLVGKDTQMHPLLVFFATLGGIAVFGIPGFIIGPIIMALFLALIEIYEKEFKSDLEKFNE